MIESYHASLRCASSLLSHAAAVQSSDMAFTSGGSRKLALDSEHMAALAAFTARSLETSAPRPFGAAIIHTLTGKLLLRALNDAHRQFDPSLHAEVRAIRLAARRLKTLSLAGYTLYTTCEPCPMCMSCALWCELDRVVYGATIEDAKRHVLQIHIPAAEVAKRSDMSCIVDGPVLRDECYALFTHPNMLRAFHEWATRRKKRPA